MGKKTFEVEKLVKVKGSGKTREFLVKWEGYPSAENTWEPLANLPKELVAEFVAPAKPAAKAAPKRKAEASPAPEPKKPKAGESLLAKKIMELVAVAEPISAKKPKAEPAPKKAAAPPKPKAAKGSSKKDDIVEVEAIIGIRYAKSGGLEYQIKWKASGKKEDVSWEPEDAVMDDDLLDDFEDAQQQAVYGSQSIKVGAFVEVRNVDDGFQNSWASAKVLKGEKTSFTVEYTQFVDKKGKRLTDSVTRSRLRLAPPKAPKSWSPREDEVIEVLEDDCWWEARVQSIKGQKAKVQYRVSDEIMEVVLDGKARPCNWLKMATM